MHLLLAQSCQLHNDPATRNFMFSLCRLQILESVIKHRWGAIDDTQRAGIRNFVSNLIIKLSSDEQLFRQERVYLNKLNIALVQVNIRCGLQVPVLQSLLSTWEEAVQGAYCPATSRAY